MFFSMSGSNEGVKEVKDRSLNKYSLAVVREVNAREGEVGGRSRGRVESCSSGR